jgi:hypothetical protein
MGTGGSFPGVVWPGNEADHLPPSSAEVKNAWSFTSTPPLRLHGVVLNSFTLYSTLSTIKEPSAEVPPCYTRSIVLLYRRSSRGPEHGELLLPEDYKRTFHVLWQPPTRHGVAPQHTLQGRSSRLWCYFADETTFYVSRTRIYATGHRANNISPHRQKDPG